MSDRRRHHQHRHWGAGDTVMAHAFLLALGRWLARHHHDPSAVITLPTGCVSAEELAQVLLALERARQEAETVS